VNAARRQVARLFTFVTLTPVSRRNLHHEFWQPKSEMFVENADIDRDTVQPQIHIEERRLSLPRFPEDGHQDQRLGRSSPGRFGPHDPGSMAVPDTSIARSSPTIRWGSSSRQLCPQADKREILEKSAAQSIWRIRCRTTPPAFRTNIFHSRERYAVVMRRIVTKIPKFDDLKPFRRRSRSWPRSTAGLVVVSGDYRGPAKSTTLASIIGKINHTRAERIINRRRPGRNTSTTTPRRWSARVEVGLRLRKLRVRTPRDDAPRPRYDPESAKSAIRSPSAPRLRAADTGHLVYTTVHATNAPDVNRAASCRSSTPTKRASSKRSWA